MKVPFIDKLKNIQFRKPTREELIEIARKSPKYIGLATLGGMLFCISFYQLVRFDAFGKVPDMRELKSIQQYEASEVYSTDKVLLGRYYTTNRTTVEYRDINKDLINALIAVEDKRFYQHKGIDWKSFPRVLVKSIIFRNKNTGGGSTLTQQLAKNLYPRKEYTFFSTPINKVREMVVAQRLEKIYDKKEILTFYLNTVSFGEDVYGIKVAAKRFFNKTPKELTIEESATLAGMLQAPTRYNPRLNKEKAQFRRNIVFAQMEKYGYLQPDQVDELQDATLQTNYQFVSYSDGLAPYFRSHLQQELENICKRLKKPDGSPYNLFTDGLKVYTTIDSRWQKHAENAVKEHMKKLQSEFTQHWKNRTLWKKNNPTIARAMKSSHRYQELVRLGWSKNRIEANFNTPTQLDIFTWDGVEETTMSPMDSIIYYHSLLNVGFLATDPISGEVRAWVGGIDHHFLKYDHVKAKRQAGSVFKPIVYTAALQKGYQPCSFIPNELTTYTEYNNWKPQNSNGKYGGWYSLRGGLAKSVNTVAAHLIHQIGIDSVKLLAEQMGIRSNIEEVPSIALGVSDLDLMELAEVYGVFANNGVHNDLRYLVRIEDKNGKTLYKSPPPSEPTEVLTPDITYQINSMLQGVVDSGTARSLRYRYGLTNAIGGKTGTTQDNADGRFMGFTPKMVGGVWVGGVNKNVRFRTTSLGSGAHMALPIWAGFYKRMLNDPAFQSWKYAAFPESEWYDGFDCKLHTDDENDIYSDYEWEGNVLERILDYLNPNNEEQPNIDSRFQRSPQRQRAPRKDEPLKEWLDKQKRKREQRQKERRLRRNN